MVNHAHDADLCAGEEAVTRIEIVDELDAAEKLIREGEVKEGLDIIKRVRETVAENRQQKGEHL